MVSLFYQINDNLGGTLANLMTVVFAMLTAGYFAAHRLDRVATFIVVTIFTGITLGLTNEVQGLSGDMARLGQAITERAAADSVSSLAWHPAAQGVDFSFISPTLRILALLMWAGSLWFFFRSRASGQTGFTGPASDVDVPSEASA